MQAGARVVRLLAGYLSSTECVSSTYLRRACAQWSIYQEKYSVVVLAGVQRATYARWSRRRFTAAVLVSLLTLNTLLGACGAHRAW